MQASATERHELIFPPHEFNPTPVFIAGVGAGGSYACLSLAKLGVKRIVCFDTDTVSSANIGPSIYGRKHVGMKKVDACAAIVYDLTDGIEIEARCEPFEVATHLEGVVFVCVDHMDVRKHILMNQCAATNTVERVFEGRMGAYFCMTHSLDPRIEEHREEWLKYWFPQSEAEPALPGCGAQPVSFGPTANICANLSVYQFTEWFAWKRGVLAEASNQIRFAADDMRLSRHFW